MSVNYVRTFPGMLKCLQLLFSVVAFICIAASIPNSARGEAFLVASVGAFVITLILLIIHILNVDANVALPWMRIEFFYCIVWAVFYLITSALVIDTLYDPYIAGGSFGLFATAAYVVDAASRYKSAF